MMHPLRFRKHGFASLIFFIVTLLSRAQNWRVLILVRKRNAWGKVVLIYRRMVQSSYSPRLRYLSGKAEHIDD